MENKIKNNTIHNEENEYLYINQQNVQNLHAGIYKTLKKEIKDLNNWGIYGICGLKDSI